MRVSGMLTIGIGLGVLVALLWDTSAWGGLSPMWLVLGILVCVAAFGLILKGCHIVKGGNGEIK